MMVHVSALVKVEALHSKFAFKLLKMNCLFYILPSKHEVGCLLQKASFVGDSE
jgi:hypothetical protein